jgi:hypothetical protein
MGGIRLSFSFADRADKIKQRLSLLPNPFFIYLSVAGQWEL